MSQNRQTTSSGSPSQGRSPFRVLVVVSQPVLTQVVHLALGHGRFVPRTASTGADGRAALEHWKPHLTIIDMDVGNGEIMAWLDTAAARGERMPVIALTRRGDLRTKLDAFSRGVDDILTVPFSPEELVARLLAIMRRTYREDVAFTPVIRLGELEIDMLNRRVHTGSVELQLTSLEQSLLYLLAANAGRLVTRDEVMDHLWGADYAADSNVVDQHVRSLRAKLQDDWRQPRFIATVPGRGYRFLPTTGAAEAPLTAP